MKLEDQVCSLELAKRLKELGVKQESAFFWTLDKRTKKIWLWQAAEELQRMEPERWEIIASAFTVAELGEMLPQQIEMKAPFYKGRLTIWAIGSGWQAAYNHEGRQTYEIGTDSEKNVANVLSKMLIHLIEKGIVKP